MANHGGLQREIAARRQLVPWLKSGKEMGKKYFRIVNSPFLRFPRQQICFRVRANLLSQGTSWGQSIVVSCVQKKCSMAKGEGTGGLTTSSQPTLRIEPSNQLTLRMEPYIYVFANMALQRLDIFWQSVGSVDDPPLLLCCLSRRFSKAEHFWAGCQDLGFGDQPCLLKQSACNRAATWDKDACWLASEV